MLIMKVYLLAYGDAYWDHGLRYGARVFREHSGVQG